MGPPILMVLGIQIKRLEDMPSRPSAFGSGGVTTKWLWVLELCPACRWPAQRASEGLGRTHESCQPSHPHHRLIAVTCQEMAQNRPGEMAGLRTEVSTPLGPDSMSLPLLPWKGRVGADPKARPPLALKTPLLSWGELVASKLVELKGHPG